MISPYQSKNGRRVSWYLPGTVRKQSEQLQNWSKITSIAVVTERFEADAQYDSGSLLILGGGIRTSS